MSQTKQSIRDKQPNKADARQTAQIQKVSEMLPKWDQDPMFTLRSLNESYSRNDAKATYLQRTVGNQALRRITAESTRSEYNPKIEHKIVYANLQIARQIRNSEPPDAGAFGMHGVHPGSGAPAPTMGLMHKPVWRVSVPTSPGWVSVRPTYLLIKAGEPFELPHFLKVREESTNGSNKNVTILEGRYQGADVDIHAHALESARTPQPPATAKFDTTRGKFWFGGQGPISAKTDPSNPVPKGVHDIEIPDFHHQLGSRYGDFGTTWFRLGHGGDRYLHPGSVSLGCSTITDTSKWPAIWRYLISSRKNNISVGELEVI